MHPHQHITAATGLRKDIRHRLGMTLRRPEKVANRVGVPRQCGVAAKEPAVNDDDRMPRQNRGELGVAEIVRLVHPDADHSDRPASAADRGE